MTILDLLLDRVRSLTGRNVRLISPSQNDAQLRSIDMARQQYQDCARSRVWRQGAVSAGVPTEVDFGFSPALQAQLDAIPDMERDENGDRDYPDEFYE